MTIRTEIHEKYPSPLVRIIFCVLCFLLESCGHRACGSSQPPHAWLDLAAIYAAIRDGFSSGLQAACFVSFRLKQSPFSFSFALHTRELLRCTPTPRLLDANTCPRQLACTRTQPIGHHNQHTGKRSAAPSNCSIKVSFSTPRWVSQPT